MASSSADAHSQPKRPAAMARQPSSSSHVSQSPSDTSHQKAAAPKGQRQHVVGQSRMQRNTSFGKNLNKLNKLTQGQPGDGNPAKHHRRSHSGSSTPVPSSPAPRPGFKRNASSGAVVRATNNGYSQAGMRKNHSSGHLARQVQSKPALKSTKNEITPHKKALQQAEKARAQSPDDHPTVHFDVGADEGADDGWTEESASQSPTTTRSNTRSNSVILDPHKPSAGENNKAESLRREAQTPGTTYTFPDRAHAQRHSSGASSHHSRPPDADMITSRLLQRSSSHNPPPQMSSVAATVTSDHHDARVLSQSAGSTLVDTPGRDLVSRFMDGDDSVGTPKDSSFLPSRGSPQGTSETERMKRNKSMPNVAANDTPTRNSQARRSDTTSPTNLPPSRTQQKLMLQRASSNIEPQKLIPSILPVRGAGPAMHSMTGITYAANGEGRLDPRLQQQFNHVATEYKVVRRYRNPLADAVARLEEIPGAPKRTRRPKSAMGINGHATTHGTNSASTSFDGDTDGTGTRRSRVNFENANSRNTRPASRDDFEGRQSVESANASERARNEAENICRRLWESTEVVEEGD